MLGLKKGALLKRYTFSPWGGGLTMCWSAIDLLLIEHKSHDSAIEAVFSLKGMDRHIKTYRKYSLTFSDWYLTTLFGFKHNSGYIEMGIVY